MRNERVPSAKTGGAIALRLLHHPGTGPGRQRRRADPYLRLNDPIQDFFVWQVKREAESSSWRFFGDHFVHFFRDVSLYGLKRAGTGLDELCALSFETAFDTALADPQWLEDTGEAIRPDRCDIDALHRLWWFAVGRGAGHAALQSWRARARGRNGRHIRFLEGEETVLPPGAEFSITPMLAGG